MTSRRAAVDPTDVDLPVGPRRRTPGLRREEVALLAGVSVTWYTWLEQGRAVNPSRSVLDAVARALLLDDAQRGHLLTLAERVADRAGPGADVSAGGSAADGLPPDALRRAVDAFDPAPTYLLGPRWEYLAWNRAQALLYPQAAQLAEPDRNLLVIVLCDPAAQNLIVEREAEGRAMVAEFRASTASMRGDPALEALIERLRADSAAFAEWWDHHDVAGFRSRLRRYDHPSAGRLTFEYQAFLPAEWPAYRIVTQLPVPGDDSTARLIATAG